MNLVWAVQFRALLSASTRHSRTRILAYTIPRFNLSALDLDPA